MNDDVTQRNAAGELEIRTVQTSGDTGTNKDDVYTRDSAGRLAVRVSGTGGGSGGPTTAANTSFDPAGLQVLKGTNLQTVGAETDAALADLQNSASILTTSIELDTEIGGITSVADTDLEAMEIDGRPSYKAPGAIVYAENGVVGIIDKQIKRTFEIVTVSVSGTGGVSEVSHDDTLSGTGTIDSPLSVVKPAAIIREW